MTTFEKSIQIAARPDKVWAQLTQPDRLRQWWTSVQKFEYASELRAGVGMTFIIEERLGAGPLAKVIFEVTRWVKNEHVAFRMVSGSGVRTYEMAWMLEPSTVGTRFTYVERFTPTHTLRDRLWGLLGRRMGMAHVEERLKLLKALAEGRVPEDAVRAAK